MTGNRLERKPCYSLTGKLLRTGHNLQLIIFVNILGIINIIEIPQLFHQYNIIHLGDSDLVLNIKKFPEIFRIVYFIEL